jgi:hypothetical protein
MIRRPMGDLASEPRRLPANDKHPCRYCGEPRMGLGTLICASCHHRKFVLGERLVLPKKTSTKSELETK